MKKVVILFGIVLLLGVMMLMAETVDKKTVRKEFYDNGKLKTTRTYEVLPSVERLIQKTEYAENGERSVGYEFENGALKMIIQYNYHCMGDGVERTPFAWDHIFNDTPIEIIVSSISGDKSQSRSSFVIDINKTTYHASYKSQKGVVHQAYEALTPEELWIQLAKLFNKEKFSALKSGKSTIEHDGLDETITVNINSGALHLTNYTGPELKEFFTLLCKENEKAAISSEETVSLYTK